MKIRGAFLGLFLLFLVSFVSAAQCPITPGSHGAQIGGQCYDCGVDDGVCPIDYGANCLVRDDDCTYEPEVFWSLDDFSKFNNNPLMVDIAAGGDIHMVATETGLPNGTEVVFNVFEKDDFLNGDDLVKAGIIGSVVEGPGGKAIGIWNIQEDDLNDVIDGLDGSVDNLEFYFNASVTSEISSTPYLMVNLTFGGGIINTCSDYNNPLDCAADAQNVSPTDTTRQESAECTYNVDWSCQWNNNQCSPSSVESEGTPFNSSICSAPRTTACSYPIEDSTESACSTGNDFFTVNYISEDTLNCPQWTSQPIACPLEVKVPFFGAYGILITLSFISSVYFFYRRRFIK